LRAQQSLFTGAGTAGEWLAAPERVWARLTDLGDSLVGLQFSMPTMVAPCIRFFAGLRA
jgi:hypothetical protein